MPKTCEYWGVLAWNDYPKAQLPQAGQWIDALFREIGSGPLISALSQRWVATGKAQASMPQEESTRISPCTGPVRRPPVQLLRFHRC